MRLFLFFSLFAFSTYAQQRFTVSGYIRESGSQELLIGVNIYLPNTTTGTTSNTYGFYSITLPAADSVTLAFSFVGYGTETRTVKLRSNLELNMQLAAIGRQLNEVICNVGNS